MRVVFVVEYDVAEDEIERTMDEVAAALNRPGSLRLRGMTVCLNDDADSVLVGVRRRTA